jgi:hypothetical protein
MISVVRKRNNPLLACITTFSFLITILFGCNYISAGSYPYAETSVFPFSEQSFIRAIDTFKLQHPKAVVPIEDLNDGRGGSDGGYWYHTYFYLPEKQTIVHCWTRPASESKTQFAIVGLNNGLELGNWKQVNKDFSSRENTEAIQMVKDSFLHPILLIIREQSGL